MPPILLFSDVDGTVLGRDGHYAVTPAELAPWLSAVEIVLASSRTVLELSRNQRDLGITGPVVAENGAVAAFPWDPTDVVAAERQEIDGRAWWVAVLGWPEARLRDAVRDAAAQTGISYVDQVDVEPGLGRVASVLVRPADHALPMESLAPLARALEQRGCTVASGGDWLAVTGDADKARGAMAVRRAAEASGRHYRRVVAIGDGDNDVALFDAADRAYVVSRPDGSWHPALDGYRGAMRAPVHGIAGWRGVVRQLAMAQEV